MRQMLALALVFAGGICVASGPKDRLPGREVTSAESSLIVGGACPGCTSQSCTTGCGTGTGAKAGGNADEKPTGKDCNGNCGAYNTCAICGL